jgi:hypothetical protein
LRLPAKNTSLFMEPQTRTLTKPTYWNLNGHRVVTSLIRHIMTIPVDGVELTKECEEGKLDDDSKFNFISGKAIRRRGDLRARGPDHPFIELEDIKWTFWGPWADLAERHGGPASITIFSYYALRH